MKRAIFKKLHSKRGASLLLALLFMLVCLTVGAVVLTAAATNAGRIQRNRLEQQDYLAVASAAELVKADMDGAKFVGEYEEKRTETVVLDYGTDENGNTIVTGSHIEPGGPFYSPSDETGMYDSDTLEKIESDLSALYYAGTPLSDGSTLEDMDYPLEFGAIDMPDIPKVTGNLTVSKADDFGSGLRQYAIWVKLSADRDSTFSNTTTMKFTPQVKSTEVTTVEVSGHVTTYTTTYTTTVTWDAPVVLKGAAA